VAVPVLPGPEFNRSELVILLEAFDVLKQHLEEEYLKLSGD